MSSYSVYPRWREDGLLGVIPGEFYRESTPDGDADTWSKAPIGAVQTKKVTANQVETYTKVKNDGRNDDWLVTGRIAQYIDYSDFTDGGSTTGTLVLTATIPAGALVERCYLVNNAAAEGETTLTIQVGDGTDADRYTTGTPSVASAANILSLGAVSGTAVHTAAISTVTVTLTEDDDFTDITAWSATVIIEYTGAAI